jgi:hypothetical protein
MSTPLPAAGVVKFADPFPARFTARQSVVMSYRPHWWWPAVSLTALGYVSVDRETGDFAVVCLSPLGVKLFEATRRGGVETVTMAWEAKGDTGEMGRAIGGDIAGLYFGIMPSEGAVRKQGRRQTTVVSERGGERTEWRFAVDTGRLARRTEWNRDGKRMAILEDYQSVPLPDRPGESSSIQYPSRVVLSNSRFHYTLTVNQSLRLRSE